MSDYHLVPLSINVVHLESVRVALVKICPRLTTPFLIQYTKKTTAFWLL